MAAVSCARTGKELDDNGVHLYVAERHRAVESHPERRCEGRVDRQCYTGG